MGNSGPQENVLSIPGLTEATKLRGSQKRLSGDFSIDLASHVGLEAKVTLDPVELMHLRLSSKVSR